MKACIMEKTEKGFKKRNIYIVSDNQAAVKALNNFQINSKLVWDYHQSLVELAKHTKVQLVWVLGHMGINRNEISVIN
jgi:ribonuclease HI